MPPVQPENSVSDSLMHDLQARLEKLIADAADCEIIGNLAADVAKRATFRRLAEQYREMAERIRAEIDARKLQGEG